MEKYAEINFYAKSGKQLENILSEKKKIENENLNRQHIKAMLNEVLMPKGF